MSIEGNKGEILDLSVPDGRQCIFHRAGTGVLIGPNFFQLFICSNMYIYIPYMHQDGHLLYPLGTQSYNHKDSSSVV